MKNHTWVTVQGRGYTNTTRCVLNNQYTVDAALTYLLSPTTLQVGHIDKDIVTGRLFLHLFVVIE